MLQALYMSNKKNKKNKNSDKELFEKYTEISKKSKYEIFKEYRTRLGGLSNKAFKIRFDKTGPNIVVKNEKRSWIYFFFKSFNDKFIFILLLLAVINYFLADLLGSLIIIGIAIVSAFIRFCEDYSTYRFNQKLKSQIYTIAHVMRENEAIDTKVEDITIGDVVILNAGTIIPADVVLVENKDLFLNQSAFTGESVLVEKRVMPNNPTGIFDISNICLMGSTVISGSGTAVVIETGFETYLGRMSKDVDTKKEATNFEIGMANITKLLIKYMIIVSILVFVIYGFIRHDFFEAMLFALSVAVGITPSMLPMIVNVNLTKGSKTLAKKKTLVKNIKSIQDLGAIDVLCTDKTGTLTQDNIILQKHINICGEEDIDVLKEAYLNSFYGTGIKNLVDRAIMVYGDEQNIGDSLKQFEKVDEVPFDYVRKRMSVVVKKSTHYKMITKGAIEEILKCCTKAKYKDKILPLTDELISKIKVNSDELSNEGMQVIGIASKNEYSGINNFGYKDESEMVFTGFVAFLDPPKSEVKEILNKLHQIGVKTKILTGDNPYATKNICHLVGLNSKRIVTGIELDQMNDEELSKVVEKVDVFARLNPIQKERVVNIYKKNGHVVGYMGDGVNDAPSLHAADVGICVDTATDISKEASDIILLEKSLQVIYDGVIEGRKVYGNIIKYMKMALSADFGDVFSIVISSIFLPFLPLLPIQMLIQDFLYDISQIAIPYDNVDKEFLEKPRKWDTKGLGRFMNVMGITSSITDVIAFIVFWFVFGYNTVEKQAYFQTAWFVECLISETMIIHYIRTSKVPFIESRANIFLTMLTIVTIGGTIATPILLHNISTFNFVILPATYYLFVVALLIIYTILVQIIKKFYIKKNGEWL